MSQEKITPSDLPTFENPILVFLSDNTAKEGLITLAATEGWKVKFFSENIAVAISRLSSSPSPVPSLNHINSISGAIAALPSKQITLTDPQQILRNDIEKRFPDTRSIKSEINLQGENTLSLIFTNVSSKLASLSEILQDEGLAQKLIRSSLIVEEDQITQEESSFDTPLNVDDHVQQDNSTNQLISVSQADESLKNNKSTIISNSSIQDEQPELNRKRKNSEISTENENENHQDKSSADYSEPSLHKKLHRSSVSETFKTLGKYIALAVILILAGLILVSRNYSHQDFYNLTQFIQLNIPPDP